MTAAESVVGEPLGELVGGQRAGQHGEHLVALDQGPAEHRGGAADGGDAGHDLGRVPVREPLVHVHVRAVEERVALASTTTSRPASRWAASRAAHAS